MTNEPNSTIDNATFIYLDHKFKQLQDRQERIDREHKEDQDKVNLALFSDLKEIKEKVDYTNGTVRKHTEEIKELKVLVDHQDCPGKTAMDFVSDYNSKQAIKETKKYKWGAIVVNFVTAGIILKGLEWLEVLLNR